MCTLYETILQLCDEKGIKPGKMCSDTGISRGLVTDLKMGRKNSIKVDTAQKIADYFDVSVDRVLGIDTKEKSPTSEDVGLIPGYSDLSEENKVKAREYIALLLGSQQKG